MAWWESCGYISCCLPSADSDEDEEDEDDSCSVSSADSDSTAINYVLGDVTHPHATQEDAIIVHCVGMKTVSLYCYHGSMSLRLIEWLETGSAPSLVFYMWLCADDSGRWGRGGLFTALEVRSDEPQKQYELAGRMKGEFYHGYKE